MDGRLFKGSFNLTRFMLRRDRVRIPLWFLGLIGLTVLIPPALQAMFKTPLEVQGIALTMSNPAIIAMMGPGYGLDNYTVGAMMGHMMLLFTAMGVAVMNIFFVVRHTRHDEQHGRIEVIRSLPVGRLANASAALIEALIVNLAFSIICGLGLGALGIETLTFQGSMLYGFGLGVVGMVFAAAAALFVQLSETSRGARAYSLAFMAVCYMLRASGDMSASNEYLSLISPLGLMLRTKVYVADRWWPIFILLSQAALIAAVALKLNSARDLGASLIPQRAGRRTASRYLQGQFGLAWRLTRTTLIAWLVTIFALGAAYGTVMGDIESFIGSNEILRQMFGVGPEQFMAVIMVILLLLSAIPSITLVFRLRSEERRGRLEHVYARAVSRSAMMGSYLTLAMISSVVMALAAVFSLWGVGAMFMAQPMPLGDVLAAGLVYLPAIWVMIGLSALLVGVFPKGTAIAWLYLVYSFFAVYFGRLISIPEWMIKLTPYGNVPGLPMEEFNIVPVLVLTAVAAVAVAVGLVGYRKRDVMA